MITDSEAAVYSAAIYDPKSTWDHEFTFQDVRVGLLNRPGRGWLLAVRGTDFEVTKLEDLFRDGDCLPYWPANHDRIGAQHRGFYTGMVLFRDAVNDVVGDAPVDPTGHSMGAAMASEYYIDRLDRDLPVGELVTIGCPNYAVSSRADAVMARGRGRDLIHPGDPVPKVPLLFRRARAATIVPEAVIPGIDPFRYHYVAGYQADLAKMPQPALV